MKLVTAAAVLAFGAPLFAQLEHVEIRFQSSGCEPCMESLESRFGRVRGVESAKLDKQGPALTVELAAANRIRLEQLRDIVQQDGTKVTSIRIRFSAEVTKEDGKALLRLPAASSTFQPDRPGNLEPGKRYTISGEIADPRPEGPFTIRIETVASL